jgi:hypothetical protein
MKNGRQIKREKNRTKNYTQVLGQKDIKSNDTIR